MIRLVKDVDTLVANSVEEEQGVLLINEEVIGDTVTGSHFTNDENIAFPWRQRPAR
jgi:hypothetical protein